MTYSNVPLHSSGKVSSCKLLLLCLPSLHCGYSQQLLVNPVVEVQDSHHLFLRLGSGCEGRVSLLPQELPGPEEGLGVLELPPHHVTPLVQLYGEIPVRLDPRGVGRVHH